VIIGKYYTNWACHALSGFEHNRVVVIQPWSFILNADISETPKTGTAT
jgi:hypothetical protein